MHDCKTGTLWGSWLPEGGERKERVMGMNIIWVYYVYMSENGIMIPIKNVKKEGEEGKGVKKELYRQGKFYQISLYACI